MKQSRHLEKLEHFKAWNPDAAELALSAAREYEPVDTLTRKQRIVYWIFAGVAAAIMVETLFFKFTGAAESKYIFSKMGTEPWMRWVQGIWAWDAVFYVIAQFTGGVASVVLVASVAGKLLAHPSVNYVATLPGSGGTGAAFLGEVVIALILMSVVLVVSNTPKLARFTGLFAGACVAVFITVEAPISGMSLNPARTFGSAVLPGLWSSLWIYFIAPPLGMLTAAAAYRGLNHRVTCAKLHHQNTKRCIFCEFQAGQKSL
jgi:hypothetical protein